jgi:hypothetical protein
LVDTHHDCSNWPAPHFWLVAFPDTVTTKC